MAKPPTANSIINNIKKGASRVVETHADIASGMILPNNSGEHTKGIKRDAPINDYDLSNKKYVDDQFPVTHASTTGQTTDDHHAETHGNSTHSPEMVETTGDTMTGDLRIFKANPALDIQQTGAVQQSSLRWVDDEGATGGSFVYNGDGVGSNPNSFNFQTFRSGAIMRFSTAGNELALTLDASQNATFTGTVTATSFSGANVTTGADPGHTHTGASLSGIDISSDTNLAGGSGITLSGDTLNLDINSLSTSAIASGDFVPFWDITATATNKKITFANFEAALSHDNLIAGTIADHDTTATGANLTTLTNDSMADTLHRHSELSASDGSPNPAVQIDAYGGMSLIGASPTINTGTTDGSDNKRMQIAGGGSTSITRGAYFNLNGNEYATDPGWVKIGAGNISGANGSIVFQTLGADNMTILRGGNVMIGTGTPTEKLDINSDAIRLRTAQTITNSTDTGTTGQICWDASYVYVCVATNTWKRATLATW